MEYVKSIYTLSHWLKRMSFKDEALMALGMLGDFPQTELEVTTDGEKTTFRVDGGRLTVSENSIWAQGAHSVVDFVVDEKKRGRGIGSRLVGAIIEYYLGEEISAQVSSISSLRVFMNSGFLVTTSPTASFEEAKEIFLEEGGSLNLRLNNNV